MQFTGIGSMLSVHFTRGPVRSPADAAKGDPKLKELFFFDMLAQGIWLARRGMFTLCLPIGDAECDRLAGAVEEFLSGGRCLPMPLLRQDRSARCAGTARTNHYNDGRRRFGREREKRSC